MDEQQALSKGRLAGRRVGLGITGSIAAYKAVELLRLFQAEGADVRVLMTPSAAAFIGPLTLETLSHHPVDIDVLALQPDGRVGHVDVANDVDAIVVAPATAHWLGAMANGLAADSITAACLATTVPVIVAPAMDGGMYAHPATQANIARLGEFGYRIVEPEVGLLASGLTGRGRLADLKEIVEATVAALAATPRRTGARITETPSRYSRQAGTLAEGAAGAASEGEEAAAGPLAVMAPKRTDLAGRHVVVTAGGTVEPIDPVRFIGNRSSGKMGVAIAQEALDRGAAVTLILAHVATEAPAGAHVARVETAAEMQAALRALTPSDGPTFDVLIMAAAVADFRPRHPASTKLARADGVKIELETTPDLLAETASRVRIAEKPGASPILVGFAAETGSLDRAPEKLKAKGIDILVANDVTEPGAGFGTDTNKVTIYAVGSPPEELPMLSKREVAELLLDRVLVRLSGHPAAAAAAEGEPEAKAEAGSGSRAESGSQAKGEAKAQAGEAEAKAGSTTESAPQPKEVPS
jgi:phosphopantothenoylcysteine decarboxylase/phosphopantothenate--cysteine ligase